MGDSRFDAARSLPVNDIRCPIPRTSLGSALGLLQHGILQACREQGSLRRESARRNHNNALIGVVWFAMQGQHSIRAAVDFLFAFSVTSVRIDSRMIRSAEMYIKSGKRQRRPCASTRIVRSYRDVRTR
jgi:hypothetical protein